MAKGRLIIMRHGESEYNLAGRMTGHANAKLTSEGIEQGRRTGHVLKKFKIDVAYVSPLDRARETLEYGLELANCHPNLKNADGSWKFETRFDLIEKDVGDFTGASKKDPKLPAYGRDFDSRLPNGETDREVYTRIKNLYDTEIKPLIDEGKTVVISCHSVVKRAFYLVLDEVAIEDVYKIKIPNAQPLVLDYMNGVKIASHIYNPLDFVANDNKPQSKNQVSTKKPPQFKK